VSRVWFALISIITLGSLHDSTAASNESRYPVSDDGTPNLIRNVDPPTGGGLGIISPRIAFDETTELFTFEDRIGMMLRIHSINASRKIAGEGIKRVEFTIRDMNARSSAYQSGKVVYKHEETTPIYCLFGGDTEEQCGPKTFAELDYQWSSGNPLYNGRYEVNIFIETDDDSGDWNFPIMIKGALERLQ